MALPYRLTFATGFTVVALTAFVSLAVLSGRAAVPLPPPPSLAELGWIPCERTSAGAWICQQRHPEAVIPVGWNTWAYEEGGVRVLP